MSLKYNPDYVVPPTTTLIEMMETYGDSVIDLAAAMDIHPMRVDDVLEGRKPITPSFARGLEEAWGLPAQFWVNLQTTFDEGRQAGKKVVK